MYEFTGTVDDLNINFRTGRANLSLEIDNKNDIAKFFDELKAMGTLKISFSKFRKKRSLNANAYAWKLMDELAQAQGISPLEVYQHQIRDVGVCRIIELRDDAVDTVRTIWSFHGTGWLSEIVDRGSHENFSLVRLYYGSSCYNTRQMSRLLDNIIQDCEALGIQTKTPKEIADMLNLWENEPKGL